MNKPEEDEFSRRRQFMKTSGKGAGALLLTQVLPAFDNNVYAEVNTAESIVKANGSRTSKVSADVNSAAVPPFAYRILMKMGFGHRPGDIEYFTSLGASDTERLTNYVDQQLNPANIDDSEVEGKLYYGGFSTLYLPLVSLWQNYYIPTLEWKQRMQPVFEAERAKFLRAIYSRRQLQELLADFWHAHFNVFGRDFEVGPVFVHYDRDVIRPNILGNFRDLLEAVTKSTAMMFYLDNSANRLTGPNENFARELLELHTFGTQSAFGFTPNEAIPMGAYGMNVGYSEEDVKAVARCLTGWTIQNGYQWEVHPGDNNTGEFLYRDDWHDPNPKRVLGVTLDGSGQDEMMQVFDMLARHPKVAEFVCEKLCRRLIGDYPTQNIVDQSAAVFVQESSAPDQLVKVVRFILLSNEFRDTWGVKVKRPFESVCSAMRALNANLSLSFDDNKINWSHNDFWFDSQNFMWDFEATGNYPFGWEPPNGYPDVMDAWLGSGQLMATWKIYNLCVTQWADENRVYRVDVNGQTWVALPNPADHTAERLADFWLERILGAIPEEQQRRKIIDYMAQGGSATQPLDIESDAWHSENIMAYVKPRLRMMVSAIIMMPKFLLR